MARVAATLLVPIFLVPTLAFSGLALSGLAVPGQHEAAAARKKRPRIAKPAQSAKTAESEAASQIDPDRPLRLVISLQDQEMRVYSGRELIETSRVSTGKAGYGTPAGVYSILEKRRWHHSNIYSRAPMPFMQRLTWSGIALHAGHVPNYPASHGCVRLPASFAPKLFSITRRGAQVIISPTHAEPRDIEHEILFRPIEAPRLTAAGDGAEGSTGDADQQAAQRAAETLADTEAELERARVQRDRSPAPLRILVTRRTGRERMQDIQSVLKELGHNPGDIDGYMGPDTSKAIQSYQRAHGLTPSGVASDELLEMLYAEAGKGPVPTGHIYVRQKFRDIFDAPIALGGRDDLLGNHIFTILGAEPGGQAQWQVVTTSGADDEATAEEALDRVGMTAPIREFIALRLTPGSSLIVSDAGLGKETGRGTDFIVQPPVRKQPLSKIADRR